MKKYFILTIFVLNFITAISQSLSTNDFNYLNQGYWQLEKNGYEPRKDLRLFESYAAKNNQSNWHFAVNQICKDSNYIGYMITGKPSVDSKQQFNLFFLNKFSQNIDEHNMKTISSYSFQNNVAQMFLYRLSTTHLYRLEKNPCKSSENSKQE
jgi:hypothetical protein